MTKCPKAHRIIKCPKAHRIITHNKVRDMVAAIYRALRMHVTVEVRGLYAQLTSYGEHKPADVLVPASVTGTDKATALDITITEQLLTHQPNLFGQRE